MKAVPGTRPTTIARAVICAALVAPCTVPVAAQEIDIDALVSEIDARTGTYDRLIEILQGTDPTRALAAFDVMTETGDATLVEVATTAALASTDYRLRARALWEILSRKDSVTLTVPTEELDEEARAALDDWIGGQSSWSLHQTFPETQCINLFGKNDCYLGYHLSISGARVDMSYANRIAGQFELDSEGRLAGQVSNPATRAIYPAVIDLR